MRIFIFILFAMRTFAESDFEKCIKNQVKPIAHTICKPDLYDATNPPMKPMILNPTVIFGGVRNLDENSMTLILWLNVNWNDQSKVVFRLKSSHSMF